MTTAPDTILGAIARHAVSRPDAVALRVADASLSWRELAETIAGFAAVARAAGASSGDRIGVLAAPSLAGVAAYLGAISAGCVAVPLPLSLREAALEGLLEDCAPTLLVADAGALGLLAPHRKRHRAQPRYAQW
jgi:acyl-CoA synthetase (AMP-forming)/AMP-acid ligase II